MFRSCRLNMDHSVCFLQVNHELQCLFPAGQTWSAVFVSCRLNMDHRVCVMQVKHGLYCLFPAG